MNVYIFILITVCKTILAVNDNSYYNVGTVLFSSSDLLKKHWTKREVDLLLARLHFQELLPPPSFLVSPDKAKIKKLLDYFRDSYLFVKREATNPETENIMNAAASDVIGGFLKQWVLPVTKFSFYGGNLNHDEALVVHNLYDEIKSYLDTDGKGWREPSADVLCSMSINIAPLKATQTRSKHHCDNLAYFEKTPAGFTIPTPTVNWDVGSKTMFVPFKRNCLVPLDSTNYSNMITNFYLTAQTCLPETERENFENRFQSWLFKDVMPHVSDSKIYPVLGGVLTLVNKTNNLCNTGADNYGYKSPPSSSKTPAKVGKLVNLRSKKMMILTVILILELAWCIPALCYFAFCKRKTKTTTVCSPDSSKISTDDRCFGTSNTPENSYNKHQEINLRKNKNINSKHDVFRSIRTCKNDSDKSNNCIDIEIEIVNEKSTVSNSCNTVVAYNKMLKKSPNVSYSDTCSTVLSALKVGKPHSLFTVKPLEKAETVTLFQPKSERGCDDPILDEKNTQANLPPTKSKAIQSVLKTSKTTMAYRQTNNTFNESKQKELTKAKNNLRLASGTPVVEIKIENIPKSGKHGVVDFNRKKVSKKRPSRIPKRTFNSEAQTERTILCKNRSPAVASYKLKETSLIPQLKHKTLDDIVVTNAKKNTTEIERKLNISL